MDGFINSKCSGIDCQVCYLENKTKINQKIYDNGQFLELFNEAIREAYRGRDRDIVQATGMLQCEASELAEIFLKNRWYGKELKGEDVLSEAGDILNFLTFILRETGFTLEDAMENNIKKLKDRGWLEE